MSAATSATNVLLRELERVHRDSIFPVIFQSLQFNMISSFECEIARTNDVVRLNSTTFWMSADRNPDGMMQMVYDDDFAVRAGGYLNSQILTAACGKIGDIQIVIGFSPTEEQAAEAVVDAIPVVFAEAERPLSRGSRRRNPRHSRRA